MIPKNYRSKICMQKVNVLSIQLSLNKLWAKYYFSKLRNNFSFHPKLVVETYWLYSRFIIICKVYADFLSFGLASFLHTTTPFVNNYRMPRIPNFLWKSSLIMAGSQFAGKYLKKKEEIKFLQESYGKSCYHVPNIRSFFQCENLHDLCKEWKKPSCPVKILWHRISTLFYPVYVEPLNVWDFLFYNNTGWMAYLACSRLE